MFCLPHNLSSMSNSGSILLSNQKWEIVILHVNNGWMNGSGFLGCYVEKYCRATCWFNGGKMPVSTDDV